MRNESTTLQFPTLKALAKFVKTSEGGHFTNVIDLTVKGKFNPDYIDQVTYIYGATIVSPKRKPTRQEDWYQLKN